MKTFNQNSHSGDYKASEISVSITVLGGTYGGGSEVLIVEDDVLEQGRRSIDSHITKLWGRAADARQG